VRLPRLRGLVLHPLPSPCPPCLWTQSPCLREREEGDRGREGGEKEWRERREKEEVREGYD
jgi:hypothetical protein